MLNITVINKKDIFKFSVKAIILVCVIAFITFYSEKDKEKHAQGSILSQTIDHAGKRISEYSFLQCLDIVIPGIKQIDIKLDVNKTSTIQKILNVEFSMANKIKLPDGTHVKMEDLSDEDKDELNLEIPEGVKTEVIENSVKPKYTNSYGSVQIKNETEFGLTDDMLIPDVEIKKSKNILIYHTHTCESYTPSDKYQYEMAGNYRTTDLNYSVARVGKELKTFLEKKNFHVIQDTTYHDYPAYSGSYNRSLTTVTNTLAENKDTEIVFDIHRDAIGDSSYAPTVKIGDEYAAQMMFVIRNKRTEDWNIQIGRKT
jgi:hypothetical protein